MIDCITFYDCDCDCLAIQGMIPWRKNGMAGSGDDFFTVVYEFTILCSYERKEGRHGWA
jgi:hypothetical protein